MTENVRRLMYFMLQKSVATLLKSKFPFLLLFEVHIFIAGISQFLGNPYGFYTEKNSDAREAPIGPN